MIWDASGRQSIPPAERAYFKNKSRLFGEVDEAKSSLLCERGRPAVSDQLA